MTRIDSFFIGVIRVIRGFLADKADGPEGIFVWSRDRRGMKSANSAMGRCPINYCRHASQKMRL